MAEFTPITTQEQFDTAIKDRLERHSKKFEGYTSPDALKAIKADYEKQIADLTNSNADIAKKYEGYEKEKAEYESKIKSYETASVKTRIAHENGLSYDAIQFLQGDDEESITASAKALKNLFGSSKRVPSGSAEPLITKEGKTDQSLRNLAKSLGGNG